MKAKYKLLHDFLNTCIKVTQLHGGVMDRNGMYGPLFQNPDEMPVMDSDDVCLMGAVKIATALEPSQALGLSRLERTALEAGFCGWSYYPNERKPRVGRLRDLYNLGAEIARKVM